MRAAVNVGELRLSFLCKRS